MSRSRNAKPRKHKVVEKGDGWKWLKYRHRGCFKRQEAVP